MPLFGPPDIEKLKAKGDVKGLIKSLHYRKDDQLRLHAIQVLADMKAVEAVDDLLALSRDKNPAVCHQAILALGRIGGRIAVDGLGALCLQPEGSRIAQAALALRMIGGESAVEDIVSIHARRLSSETIAGIRSQAARALGLIGGARAVEGLLPGLSDKDYSVRGSVRNALVLIRAPAVLPLVALLRTAGQAGGEAIMTLVQFGPQVADSLVALLEEDRWEGKAGAVTVLKKIMWTPAPGSVGEVVFNIVDEKWDRVVRAGSSALPSLRAALKADHRLDQVLKTMGSIGGIEAIRLLLPCLSDPNSSRRWQAAQSLRQAGWQPGTDENAARYWCELGEWTNCVQIGAPAVIPLIEAMSGDQRRKAAGALLQIYMSAGLDPSARDLILAQRERITGAHTDGHQDHTWLPPQGCDLPSEHTDQHDDLGIGLDFPL